MLVRRRQALQYVTIGQHPAQPKPHQVGSRHARLAGKPMQLAMILFRQHQLKSNFMGAEATPSIGRGNGGRPREAALLVRQSLTSGLKLAAICVM